MENKEDSVIDESIYKMEEFARLLKEFGSLWEACTKEQSHCDLEICDLLHEIESSPLSIYDDYMLVRDLHNARTRRRQAKNIIAAMEPFRKYFDAHRSMEMDLFKVCREIKQIRKSQIEWNYRPRVREDLKICRNHAKHRELKEQKPSA